MISLDPLPEVYARPMVRFLEGWFDGVASAPDGARVASPEYARAFWLGHEARRQAVRAEAVRMGVLEGEGTYGTDRTNMKGVKV
jgi:hypothetical protein